MTNPTFTKSDLAGNITTIKAKRKNLIATPFNDIYGSKSDRILEWAYEAGIEIDFVGQERQSFPPRGLWSLDPKYHSFFKLKWS